MPSLHLAWHLVLAGAVGTAVLAVAFQYLTTSAWGARHGLGPDEEDY